MEIYVVTYDSENVYVGCSLEEAKFRGNIVEVWLNGELIGRWYQSNVWDFFPL